MHGFQDPERVRGCGVGTERVASVPGSPELVDDYANNRNLIKGGRIRQYISK
jgi:hypothetical protein